MSSSPTTSPAGPTGPSTILCDNPALRNAWYAVARSIDVGAGPMGVTVLGTKVVLYRSNAATNAVIAAPDRCPHREAPLSAGHVTDGCLVCPYHGWTFGADGRCVRVPSSADNIPAPPRAHLATYPTVEKYGLVWICVGTPSGDAPDIPIIPNESDQSFRRINTPVDIWRCSATRMADNFLDISHFPFVHVGTFGIAQETEVLKVQLEDLDDGWYGYKYDVRANNTALGTLTSGQSVGVVERAMSSGFHLPFDVRSTIVYHSGLQHILLLLSTPIDDVTSYFTFVVWRNDDFAMSAEEIIRFDLSIGAEDKRMLEQLDGVLPLDKTTLVNTQADKASVEWRRRLYEAMNS